MPVLSPAVASSSRQAELRRAEHGRATSASLPSLPEDVLYVDHAPVAAVPREQALLHNGLWMSTCFAVNEGALLAVMSLRHS